jgi:hypothetical protein
VKLTPLNIVTSLGLVAGVLLTFSPDPPMPVQKDINHIMVVLSFLTAVVAFISDLIFRKFIPEVKRLWLVESSLIVFTVILVVILKISTS